MKYILKITPAIPPEVRHEIEDTLELNGYHVRGGGQSTKNIKRKDSFSDISFEKREKRKT